MYEEEINLRLYIEILIAHWKWVIGAAVLAAVTAFVVSSLLPPTYEAETAVAIVRSRTDVSFDPRIVTEEDAVLGNQDVGARREALVALVKSSDVAATVLETVGDQLQPEERTIPDLLQIVKASSEGDLINIKVQYSDPVIAAKIANEWGQSYERHVNELYGSSRTINLDVVVEQVAEAKRDYEDAQSALEASIRTNSIATLQREIAAREELLNTYQSSRNAIQTQPVDLQLSTTRRVLADYYADLQRIERWLADAQALRNQVVTDNSSTAANLGNALALMGLRNRVFGGESAPPVELQLDMTDGGLDPVTRADVDALITVLEQRRTTTEAQIETYSASLLTDEPNELEITSNHPLNVRISTLSDEISALKSDLAAQEAEQNELQQGRDLAWETYQSLTRKQAEVEIAAQTTGTEVRVAGKAAVPKNPVAPRLMMNVVLAGIVGLNVAIGLVFVLNWWTQQNETEGRSNVTKRTGTRAVRPLINETTGAD